MDNLTHSVVGLAIGELVQRSVAAEPTPERQRTRRRLLLTSAWAASNFPDLDLVLTGLMPAPLGYLLHHRGHTHTLLYLLPQAALLFAVLWLLWPGARALLRESRPARLALAAAIGVGLVFHIVMDALNSYGVHPFDPIDSGWIFGDLVFILEPVFWVALGVPTAMTAPSKIVRAALLAALAGILGWASVSAFLHWSSALLLAMLGLGLAFLQARAGASGRFAIGAGIVAAAGYIGIQAIASSSARASVSAQAAPGARVLDVVLTAYPANPFCWTFISIEREPVRDSYRMRRGQISVAPALVPLPACPRAFAEPGAVAKADPALRVVWESEAALAELRTRMANCHFQAWMRFARVPMLGRASATDARFSMKDGSNFSTFDFAAFEGKPCPANAPGWDMPRADLLSHK
ncbi:MAG: metal-dependent hydrolase [Pseudomonadota bacterium]